MALYLVRHGQTDWNLQRRFQSRSDIPLNATGITQAQKVQMEFKRRELNFVAVHSSPKQRAIDTANIIVGGSGLCIQQEPDFVELDLGEYEGRFEAELEQEYGAQFNTWRASEFTVAAPGGETIFAAAARVKDSLFAFKQSAIDGDVLVVAHQGVMMAMKSAISGQQDLESLATYRQANNEVDVWDFFARHLLERIRID